MRLQDHFALATRSLLRHKLRTILTMLGMIIGVAAVVVLTSLGLGARELVEREIARLGTQLLTVQPRNRSTETLTSSSATHHRLTEADARALVNEVAAIAYAVPVVTVAARLVSRHDNWPATVAGTHPEFLAARDWEIRSGRNFTASEVMASAKVMLLGTTVAEKLSRGESLLGQIVRVDDVPLRVIGLLAEKGQSAAGQDQDDLVVAPISTVKARLLGGYYREYRDAVAYLLVKGTAGSDQDTVGDAILRVLKHRHGLSADDPPDFWIRDPIAALTASRSASESLTWLLAAIASVSLLVGGISIMNIMLVCVAERAPEIGIRMAVGAGTRDVLAQFLVEAASVALLGGAVGVAIGAGTAAALQLAFGWTMLVDAWICLGALTFSALVGLAAGLYPAIRAAAVDPIEAIRS